MLLVVLLFVFQHEAICILHMLFTKMAATTGFYLHPTSVSKNMKIQMKVSLVGLILHEVIGVVGVPTTATTPEVLVVTGVSKIL